MVALWASVVAVGGARRGVVIRHLFQSTARDRTERDAPDAGAREAVEAFVTRAARLTR